MGAKKSPPFFLKVVRCKILHIGENMKRFIQYPNILQFRAVVRAVGNAGMITVNGTEKVHGTNASVCFTESAGLWSQSRERILSLEADNAECAAKATANSEAWITIIKKLAEYHQIDLSSNIVTLFYEWAGYGIQKKSALSGVEKSAMIFTFFKVSPLEENTGDDDGYWVETKLGEVWADDEAARIFNVNNFKTWQFVIDFSDPVMSVNKMIDIVNNEIEPSSPIGRQFGMPENIGEGLVVSFLYKGKLHQFKVKGEKHTNTKVRKLGRVDDEHLQELREFAQKMATPSRLMQMYDLANDTINNGEATIENMGKFIKMVYNDIIKEEGDIIAESGYKVSDVMPIVSIIARRWFIETLNSDV